MNVSAWDADSLIEAMINAAAGRPNLLGPRSTIHYANVHVLNTAYRNAALRSQLQRASTVYCDGAGVRFAATLLGSHLPPRLTAADWIDAFCACAARDGIALYLLAGAEGVAKRAASLLASRHDGLRIGGIHSGYVDAESSRRLITEINQSAADVVIVGMGTPIQELWISKYRQDLAAPVVWSVGALFDFVAGVQRRAPDWMLDLGLEWLWRWITSPARFFSRYVIGNPLFILRVLRQRFFGLPADLGDDSRPV